jgi:hypothetical protein
METGDLSSHRGGSDEIYKDFGSFASDPQSCEMETFAFFGKSYCYRNYPNLGCSANDKS